VIFIVLLPINHDKILLRWYGEWRGHVPLMVLLLLTFILGMASAVMLFAANYLFSVFERRGKKWLPGSHRKAGSLLAESETKLKKGDEVGAEAALQEATKIYPALVEAYEALARLYLMQGRKDAAVTEYNKAVAVDPKNIRLQVAVAYLSLETGDTARALKAFKDILDIEPEYAPARRLLPSALAEAAQWEDAVKAQEALLKILPKHLAAQEEVNFLAYRTEYARSIISSDPGKAAKILNEVLKSDPGFIPAALAAAEIYSSKHKPKEAFNTLAAAFMRRPEPFLYERLANMKADESKLVEDLVEEALRENPRRHALRIARAKMRLQKDMPEEALDELSKISGEPEVDKLLVEAASQMKLGKHDRAAEALNRAIKALSVEYTCSACGWPFNRWIARCANCKAFNSMTARTD